MLTQATHYALIALLHLARSEGEVRSGQSIATAEQIPGKYLQHLMTDLRKAGLVMTLEGHTGGHRLARSAATISIADVLRAMIVAQREQTHARDIKARRSRPETNEAYQRATAAIVDAYEHMYAELGTTTLADLMISPA
jgi:Rrf2 family protein